MSAKAMGNPSWVDKTNLKERHAELLEKHHDLIMAVAEVVIDAAKRRDLEEVLFITLSLQKAVDSASNIIEEDNKNDKPE